MSSLHLRSKRAKKKSTEEKIWNTAWAQDKGSQWLGCRAMTSGLLWPTLAIRIPRIPSHSWEAALITSESWITRCEPGHPSKKLWNLSEIWGSLLQMIQKTPKGANTRPWQEDDTYGNILAGGLLYSIRNLSYPPLAITQRYPPGILWLQDYFSRESRLSSCFENSPLGDSD